MLELEDAKFTNEVQHRYKPELHFVCEFSVAGLIAEFVEKNSNSKECRYEDLFQVTSHGEKIHDMFDFLADFPGREYNYDLDKSRFRKPVHAAGRASFPDWPEWDSAHARQLNDICGALTKRFGYGGEPDWHDLLRM